MLDFSHRPAISTYTDYFIQDGEDRVYRKILELNEGKGLRWMENALNFTISSGIGTVPTDYLGLKGAQVVAENGQYDLIQKDSQWIYSRYPVRSATAPPSFIAIDAGSFIFGPFPDSGYQVLGTYYQRAAALSASNTTTWMTTNMPLALFAGCMASLSKFLKDLEGAQAWMAELADRLSGVIAADKAAMQGDGQLQIACADPAPGSW